MFRKQFVLIAAVALLGSFAASCKVDVDGDKETIPDPSTLIAFEQAPVPLPDASPQPEYPEIAKANGGTGKVVTQVYVGKDGQVKKWQIIKVEPTGLGFESAVEKVISRWRFAPAMQEGNPVGVWIAIPFNFQVKQ